jgi:hypothetical protein
MYRTIDEPNALLEAGRCPRRDQLQGKLLGGWILNYSYRATTLVSLVSVCDGEEHIWLPFSGGRKEGWQFAEQAKQSCSCTCRRQSACFFVIAENCL